MVCNPIWILDDAGVGSCGAHGSSQFPHISECAKCTRDLVWPRCTLRGDCSAGEERRRCPAHCALHGCHFVRIGRAHCNVQSPHLRCVQSLLPAQCHPETAYLRVAHHDLRVWRSHGSLRLHLESRHNRPRLALPVCPSTLLASLPPLLTTQQCYGSPHWRRRLPCRLHNRLEKANSRRRHIRCPLRPRSRNNRLADNRIPLLRRDHRGHNRDRIRHARGQPGSNNDRPHCDNDHLAAQAGRLRLGSHARNQRTLHQRGRRADR